MYPAMRTVLLLLNTNFVDIDCTASRYTLVRKLNKGESLFQVHDVGHPAKLRMMIEKLPLTRNGSKVLTTVHCKLRDKKYETLTERPPSYILADIAPS